MDSAIVTQLAVGRARLRAHQGHDSKALVLSTPSEPRMKQSHAISGHKDGRSRLAYNVIALRGNLAFLQFSVSLTTCYRVEYFPVLTSLSKMLPCDSALSLSCDLPYRHQLPWPFLCTMAALLGFFFLLDNWVWHGKGQGETDRICPVTNSNTCTLFDSNTCTI